MKDLINKIGKVLQKIEDYTLVLLFSTMIAASIIDLILRIISRFVINTNLVNTEFWGAVSSFHSNMGGIVQYSVLWTGLIAAGIAASLNKHIKIDIFGMLTKGRVKNSIQAFTNLTAAVVCIFIAIWSIIYIVNPELHSSNEIAFFKIPKRILSVIFPYGFTLMGIRFLYHTGEKIYNIIMNKEDETVDSAEYTVELENIDE